MLILISFMIVLSGCRTSLPPANGGEAGSPAPVPTSEPAAETPAPSAPSTPAESPAVSPTKQPSMPSPTPSPELEQGKKVPTRLPIEHMVIVIEENHSFKQIVGNSDAPYLQSLIAKGALFTNAHGVTHPSQPNYLAFFSGSTQGVTNDSCKGPFSAPNLASELMKRKLSFSGYSEDMPKTGYSGCSYKQYARKHNPWAQFTNVPADANKPFSDFPKDFSRLPTVSFVIPNEKHDMHSGSIRQADDWLKANLGPYVSWAETHQSLLILTWDEDDFSKKNQIPMILVGPMINPGKYAEKVNHYSLLKWIEEAYKLPQLGKSKNASPLPLIWRLP